MNPNKSALKVPREKMKTFETLAWSMILGNENVCAPNANYDRKKWMDWMDFVKAAAKDPWGGNSWPAQTNWQVDGPGESLERKGFI